MKIPTDIMAVGIDPAKEVHQGVAVVLQYIMFSISKNYFGMGLWMMFFDLFHNKWKVRALTGKPFEVIQEIGISRCRLGSILVPKMAS